MPSICYMMLIKIPGDHMQPVGDIDALRTHKAALGAGDDVLFMERGKGPVEHEEIINTQRRIRQGGQTDIFFHLFPCMHAGDEQTDFRLVPDQRRAHSAGLQFLPDS